MTAPYDDSTQKEWKERKDKIEGYYREMGQVGTPNNEKVSSIIVAKSGDKLIVQFSDGDGILYEIIEDLVSPLRMIKTCLLYTSPSPRDRQKSRMPSSA